jgi:hypothetical protein
LPDVFYSRLFQIAAGAVFCTQMLRLGAVWFPAIVPAPNLGWWIPWEKVFPTLSESGAGNALNGGSVLFLIIGVTYFTASEISFTVGASQFLLVILMGQYYLFTGQQFTFGDAENSRSGAYIAYALILAYTGRDYYWRILRAAAGLAPANDGDEKMAIAAARWLAFGFVAMLATLIYGFDFDWLVALLFTLATLMLFLSFTRVICETGLPYFDTGWKPGHLLANALGSTFLGQKAIVASNYLSTIFAQDPRECLMPYVSNSLKVADDNRVKLRPLLLCGVVAVVLALAVAFTAKFVLSYSFGTSYNDTWAANTVPVQPFDEAARAISTLSATGQLEAANAATGVSKLFEIAPESRNVTFVLLGVACIAVFSFLRFRFTNWPLHPVLFLIWGVYPSRPCARFGRHGQKMGRKNLGNRRRKS